MDSSNVSRKSRVHLTEDEQSVQLQKLRNIMPNAIVFSVTPRQFDDGSSTESADEDDVIPITIPALLESFYDLDKDVMLNNILLYAVTDSQVRNLSNRTANQSGSPLWAAHRIGRITASLASSVMAFNGANIPVSTVNSICTGGSMYGNNATQWGKDHESDAIASFTEIYSSEHENARVDRCGLYICKSLFFLGASPDSIISCSCCGKGVLEVKCPYKYRSSDRDELLLASASDRNFCLDGNLVLKKSHKYYAQVQCQMGVTETSRCSFVLYTTKTVVCQVVIFDREYFEEFKCKCVPFFSLCILPKLLNEE